MYLSFYFTIFFLFSGNFIIPSSKKFLPFWSKNCCSYLLQTFREVKYFFHYQNKWTNGNPKPQYLIYKWMNKKIPDKTKNNFYHVVQCYPDRILYPFFKLIIDIVC